MSIRLPSAADKIEALWLGLDAAGRHEFVAAAIARKRPDAIRVALSRPAAVPSLDKKSYTKLTELIASHDAVDILVAIGQMGAEHDASLRRPLDRCPNRNLAAEAVRHRALNLLAHTVASGMDPFVDDPRYGTSLAHMIAAHGWVEGLLALDKSAADLVSVRDGKGRSLLHTAARHGQPEMVSELLSQGADPHVRDSQHRTPFFRCVAGDTEGMGPTRSERWMEVAALLMQHGCSIQEHIGKTERSQVLADYLACNCPDLSPALMAFLQQRTLQDATAPAHRVSASPRL